MADASPSENASRIIAVSTVVMVEMWYRLNSRYILRPVLSREGLFGNPSV